MRNLNAALIAVLVLAFLVFGLPGCRNAPVESPRPIATDQSGPLPTVRSIPTLYPTATVPATLEPTSTRPPEPTEPPSTPINFEQIVVDLRYAIPAISLDRKIVGNVSSRIEVIDQIAGKSTTIPDQPGILVELQQALNKIQLEELPEDCDTCVLLEYELPLVKKAGRGWLQDVQLLASLENYTTVHLDPHFPPGTVLGLRQSATPYQVAHSIALTADGQLWRWSATDDQVTLEITEQLPAFVDDIPERQILDSLLPPERVSCPEGPGVETLYIATDGELFDHDFACPELTLASSLLPLYLNLDRLAAEGIAESEHPEPDPIVPLDGLVDYQQVDGAGLTIFRDGLALVRSTDGITQSAILTRSLIVSATSALIDSQLLQPGVEGLISEEEANVLFVRGPLGVHTLRWMEADNPGMAIVVGQLTALRDQIELLAASIDSDSIIPADTLTATPEAE